jgi:hypothetical protein
VRGQTLEVTVLGSSWNVMDVVCQANMFNDGCDSNFGSSTFRRADPNSSLHWVRVDVDFKNITNQLINMWRDYNWAVVIGGRIYGIDEYPVGVDSIREVQFLPGSIVRTSVYAPVPKAAGTADLLLVLRLVGVSDWAYFGT